MKTLADRLKEERKRLGLTQAQWGELTDVGGNAQSNYEKGARSPTSDYLEKASQHGMDILYVLTGQRAVVDDSALTKEEAELLRNYNAADESGKALIDMAAAHSANARPGKRRPRR